MTAASYPITVDQLEDGHALILGTTGSGKTYQLRGMLEQLRRADRRVGAIDKLGNHWGLTLAADGKAPGVEFVIFGGKRAHVPMTPDQGARLGRLFIERNIPAIFDVSQWKADEQQRWVAAFADAVFEANAAAIHLAFDEAQSWVPQGGGGEAFRSVQRLAEQGRGNGVRLLLTCQRLSRLDATVRGMAHTVIAMRQTGVLDRKAVRELISAGPEDSATIERDLPKMPVGTGYVWTAGEAALRRVVFPRTDTFDSSRTPRHGDTPPAPIAVSSALVDELRAALAPADPPQPVPAKAGREGNRAELGGGGGVAGEPLDRDEYVAKLEAQNADFIRANAECAAVIGEQIAEISEFRSLVADAHRRAVDLVELLGAVEIGGAGWPLKDAPASSPRSAPAADLSPPRPAEGASPKPGSGDFPDGGEAPDPAPSRPPRAPAEPGELNALARQLAGLLVSLDALPWEDLAVLVGRKSSGGWFRQARRALIDAGLVADGPDGALATDALHDRRDIASVPWPGPGEILARWSLKGAGPQIARVLRAYPAPFTRADLAARLGLSPAGGWFRAGVKDVLAAGLAREEGGRLVRHPFLEQESKGAR